MKAPVSPPRQLPEAGTHIAVLYLIADLGTHRDEFQGDVKIRHKVRFTWETPELLAIFKEGGLPEPFSVGKTFTLSMHKKAALRGLIETWRGKTFTDDEAAQFEFQKMLGQPCLITINHKAKQDGGVYADIGSVARLMKGQIAGVQHNPSILYEIDMGECAVLEKLPEWMREEVRKSAEFRAPKVVPPAQPKAAAGGAVAEDEDFDKVPF